MRKKFGLWLRDRLIRRKGFNGTRMVAGSFAVIILVGALLLTLPFSSNSGEITDFFTCLFTATSATCVTGLVLVDTAVHWSVFGQAVILVMIQLGGLGFMTVITLFSFALRRRIGLSERLVMVSTLNLNDMDGVVRVVRHALMGTFAFEGVGAVILSLRFIPEFGLAGGIWRGLFHAVSAFCNAGFDLMGARHGEFSSLTAYASDPAVLLTAGALVIIGGLGFFVWEDIWEHKNWKGLSLYSKLVLGITGGLLLGGAVFILGVEYDNPATLGELPVWEKLLNALFQSVTLRTAGFDAIGQSGLRDASKALSSILMLVGGSSGSTAGGIKTVTVGVLLLSLRSGLMGREQVTVRGRSIPFRRVLNAMTLVLVVLALFLFGSMVISTVEPFSYLDVAFEVASALGTVGLSAGLTPLLSPLSKGLIVIFMYIGRVGILSFSIAFLMGNRRPAKVQYPSFDIMIG